MLKNIRLINYLTIKNLEIKFTDKLNILTGETGAGKSLILSSIELFISKRFPKELKRKKNENLEIILEIQDDDEIILLKRLVNYKNQSQYYINMTESNYEEIIGLFEKNILFFSQKKYIELLGKKNHIEYIDQYCLSSKKIMDFFDIYSEYRNKINEYEKLEKLKKDISEKKDFYTFKLNELDKINIEDEDQELKFIEKIKKIKESKVNIDLINNIINEIDEKILHSLSSVIKDADKIETVTKESESLNIAYTNIEDVSFNLSKLVNNIDNDDIDYESIEDQLYLIKELKRKYGLTLTELLNERDSLRSTLNSKSNIDDQLKDLGINISAIGKKVLMLAEAISQIRKNSSNKFSKKILNHLKDLGINKCNWLVSFRDCELNSKGIDDIEFLFSSTDEIPPGSLSKVASGGEISRILLSIALELSDSLKSKTIIFDEPDIGLGGAIAEKLGQKISSLSKTSQVICISHLPQVAAFADNHILIKKNDSEISKISVSMLNEDEKIGEIARMLSGETLEDEAYILAKKMIR